MRPRDDVTARATPALRAVESRSTSRSAGVAEGSIIAAVIATQRPRYT